MQILFQELKLDMESNQPRVQSLKETADQLLINDDSAEMLNAKDKTHIISNRLRALLRLCKSYIVSLEERLNVSPDVASPVRIFKERKKKVLAIKIFGFYHYSSMLI